MVFLTYAARDNDFGQEGLFTRLLPSLLFYVYNIGMGTIIHKLFIVFALTLSLGFFINSIGIFELHTLNVAAANASNMNEHSSHHPDDHAANTNCLNFHFEILQNPCISTPDVSKVMATLFSLFAAFMLVLFVVVTHEFNSLRVRYKRFSRYVMAIVLDLFSFYISLLEKRDPVPAFANMQKVFSAA